MRKGLAALCLMAGGLVVGGAVAEGGIRLYAALNPRFARLMATSDPTGILIEPHGQYGFRQKPGAVYTYRTNAVAHTNALGWRGPEVATDKPPGTLRVVLLGESTTHGFGVADSETIDTYMRDELRQRLGRPVEVVNLAFDGYDAWQIWERLRDDGLRLHPDLVIVNTGVNDVRSAKFEHLAADPDERTLIWEADLKRLRADAVRGGPSIAARLKHTFYLVRIVTMIRNRKGMREASQAVRSSTPHPDAMDYFERNIHRIAALADSAHVPLILSTPASSLRSKYQPHETSATHYWVRDAETTQQYRDSLAGRLRKVADSLRAQGRPSAYLSYDLPPELFLDDCHLTPAGNRAVAIRMADAVIAMLRPRS